MPKYKSKLEGGPAYRDPGTLEIGMAVVKRRRKKPSGTAHNPGRGDPYDDDKEVDVPEVAIGEAEVSPSSRRKKKRMATTWWAPENAARRNQIGDALRASARKK